jgi:hypothetical protein
MALVAPFHSSNPNEGVGLLGLARLVHHNNNACTEGNNIEVKYWTAGSGGRPLCHRCAQLGVSPGLAGLGGMFGSK